MDPNQMVMSGMQGNPMGPMPQQWYQQTMQNQQNAMMRQQGNNQGQGQFIGQQNMAQSNTVAQQPGFRIAPVASYDEAKAVPTDFMGSMILMPDLSHGYIYTKIFNPNTGSSIFGVYRMVTIPDQQITPPVPMTQEQPQNPAYDPREDIKKLKEELDSIKKELGIASKEE